MLEQVAEGLKLQGKASEHDVVVSSHLAYVLTGGNCSPLDVLTEQDILDLEREAFVELCKHGEDAGAHGGAAHHRQAAAQLACQWYFQAPSGSRWMGLCVSQVLDLDGA